MAEETDDSQKTEDPTQKRLEDARKKGQIALSREINNWLMLLAGTILIGTAASPLMANLRDYLRVFIEQPHLLPQVGGFGIIMKDAFWHVFGALALPLIILMMIAFLGPFLQVGPLFAPEAVKPDISKISLIKGFGRLFSKRALMEFVKGLLKLGIISVVGVVILTPYFERVDHFVGLPASLFLSESLQLVIKLMSGILVVLIVVAIIDIVYQRQEHTKRMRMSKQEVKDEFKQSEGDPHVKGRLRQLRAEKARQRMMQSVPRADVVITNPTHFAVALEYKPDKMDAPVCVAKGTDDLALRIREKAKEHDIVIYENRPLARVLYDTVEIDESIPEEHYKAVAEVISYVFKLKGKVSR